jgi:hypothetical protein
MAATRGLKAVFVSPRIQALRAAKRLNTCIFISLVVNVLGRASPPSRINLENDHG